MNLLPRSTDRSVQELAHATQQMSIFGGAKPRDEKMYEQKVYEEKAKKKLGDMQHSEHANGDGDD